MLGFLLPSLFACQYSHAAVEMPMSTSISSSGTTSSTSSPSNMEDQTTPSRQRRSRWLYRSLLLTIAEWAREPSSHLSPTAVRTQHYGKEEAQADVMKDTVPATEDEMAGNHITVGIAQRWMPPVYIADLMNPGERSD
jgi:hypothetical protein